MNTIVSMSAFDCPVNRNEKDERVKWGKETETRFSYFKTVQIFLCRFDSISHIINMLDFAI